MARFPDELSDQSTLHVSAPDPPLSAPRSLPPTPQTWSGADAAAVWNNAANGEASMLPAIRPAQLGPVAANHQPGASPSSPPGFQQGYQQRYDGRNDHIAGGGWDSDSADDDAAGWEKLTSQHYAAVNPNESYLGESTAGYLSPGSMRPQPEYSTSDYASVEGDAYRAPAGETSDYQAANSWGDGYTGEYTGSGYTSGEDSREMDGWPSERLQHGQDANERGFSPTQLGLPRLTNPSLGADLPSAWRDIVSGALPPPLTHNGWDTVEPRNGANNLSGWNEEPGYSESLSAYTGQMDQPASTNWPELESRGSNRRSPGAPLVPLEEQRVWTTGTSTLRHRNKWSAWLIVLILLVVLATSGFVIVQRPQLCPIHACQTISAKVHKIVPAIGVPSAQPPASLNAKLSSAPLSLVTGKTGTTTLTLTNAGPGVAHWTATSDSTWLTLDENNGALAANQSVTLTLTASAAGLHQGANTAAITVTSNNQVLPIIPVTVSVTAG